jgi:uncharacterized membrane protein YgdD (TMEM256/DUF423 family)
MRQNKALRSLAKLAATASAVLFTCVALFTGWMLNLSFNAATPAQSPLNPIGLIVFVVVWIAALAIIMVSVFVLLRERRWANEDAEKPKNDEKSG